MALKENLIKLRERAGYKQAKEFARAAGIPYSSYIVYEKGSWPNETNLLKIARALRVSIDTLLDYNPEHPDELTECKEICEGAGLPVEIFTFRKNTSIFVYRDKNQQENAPYGNVDGLPALLPDDFISAVKSALENPAYVAAKIGLLKMYLYASILQKYAMTAGNANINLNAVKNGTLPKQVVETIRSKREEEERALRDENEND